MTLTLTDDQAARKRYRLIKDRRRRRPARWTIAGRCLELLRTPRTSDDLVKLIGGTTKQMCVTLNLLCRLRLIARTGEKRKTRFGSASVWAAINQAQ